MREQVSHKIEKIQSVQSVGIVNLSSILDNVQKFKRKGSQYNDQ